MLSPDVAPFVPRAKCHEKKSIESSDAKLPALSNAEVIGIGNHDNRNPSTMPVSSTGPMPQQRHKTQRGQVLQIDQGEWDAHIEVRHSHIENQPSYCKRTMDASTNRADVSSQIPQFGYSNYSQLHQNTKTVLEQKKAPAFVRQAQHYDCGEKQDHTANIDRNFRTDFGLRMHRTRQRNDFSENARWNASAIKHEASTVNPSNVISKAISGRRKMTTVSEFDNSKIKFEEDADCKSEMLLCKIEVGDDSIVKQSIKDVAATVVTLSPEAGQNAATTLRALPLPGRDNIPRKKKTDAKRKSEFKNKVKQLPSGQGKVLTVTNEFYNMVIQNECKITSLLTKDGTTCDAEEVQFGPSDFPALGDDAEELKLMRSFQEKCAVKKSPESDSDWSDLDPVECSILKYEEMKKRPIPLKARNSSIGKSSGLSKPVMSKINELKTCTYAASVKKKTENQDSGSDIGANKPSLFAKPCPVEKSEIVSLRKKPKANSLIELNLLTMLNKTKTASKDGGKRNGISSNKRKNVVKVKPVVANILDSSAPSRRRGKERETPAKRKSTPMKKIILRERAEKKLKRLTAESHQHVEGEIIAVEVQSTENQGEKNAENNIACKDAMDVQKPAIHTRKFREYCNQMLNPEIDETVTKLIQDLIRFQDRLYQKDPMKAKMRRRLVVGLREVTKHLKLKKLKCIILAPNLEKIISEGGLDEAMTVIISLAEEQQVPFMFALGRKGLGRVCLKKVPVSAVGIFNYDGSEANFKHLCTLAKAAQEAYHEATRQGMVAQ